MNRLLAGAAWVCCSILSAGAAIGQSVDRCGDVQVDEADCAYAGLNGNCTIVVDRLSPATPPIIFAKPDAIVTIKVVHPSPFEDLTLDWKSTTVVLPPDTLASLMSAQLTGVLGKLTVLQTLTEHHVTPTDADEIMSTQEELQKKINPLVIAKPALDRIKLVLQPPPADLCWAKPLNGSESGQSNAWFHTDSWKEEVVAVLREGIENAAGSKIDDLKQQVKDVDARISNSTGLSSDERKTLESNQKVLKEALTAREKNPLPSDLGDRLSALVAAIAAIPDKAVGLTSGNEIRNAHPKDKNYQTQVWVLNYTNKLSPVAKRVSAEKLSADLGPLGALGETPAKQPLVTVTVQFQHSSRLELSSGLLIPASPYHTYTKAAVATNGVVTNNIVQENRTYTVIPAVFVNVLGHEFTGRQRLALFTPRRVQSSLD